MRIKNTIRNSAYAVVSYLVLAILALLVRKIFIRTLSIDLLGYEGLFNNIFSLLALADLGIESLILYRLFPAFANENRNEINKIMSVYRLLYKYVGIVVLIVGIILTPFLKYIISGNNLAWNYVYIIYFVQLSSTLCTYFLAYKRLMFTVSQQEFECIKTDTLISLVFNLVKIAVLILFQNYILYLLCNLGTNILSNIIISFKVKKHFDYFETKSIISTNDIRSLGLDKDIRNNLVQKVCGTIYGGTDNIVVSILLGIKSVGILSNYLLIQNYVTNFLTKLLKPFQMSIGNYIYSCDNNDSLEMFRMFDFISYCFACVISLCYFSLFNPFITLWLGKEYLLSQLFVVSFSINQYILWNHQFLSYYRYSFGKYELDKTPIFIAAILNIILSVLLCNPFGIGGIMIGTAVSHLGMWFGRVRVVYTEYIYENIFKYIFRQLIRLFVWGVELLIINYLCRYIVISPVGIIIRLFICIIIPSIINAITFIRTNEVKKIIIYAKKTIKVMKNEEEKR